MLRSKERMRRTIHDNRCTVRFYGVTSVGSSCKTWFSIKVRFAHLDIYFVVSRGDTVRL